MRETWEAAVFRIAATVALVHALDDAFLDRQPGVPASQHAIAGLLSLGVGT